MNRKTAEKVLKEVQDFVGYSGEIGPQLMDCDHEGLSEGSWSICFEGGMDQWAGRFRSNVPGVHTEAILGCILGVYDA